jgi:hypothetical protein
MPTVCSACVPACEYVHIWKPQAYADNVFCMYTPIHEYKHILLIHVLYLCMHVHLNMQEIWGIICVSMHAWMHTYCQCAYTSTFRSV